MNEKFWDLKKSKQDNMINGALRIFARDGFRHASTDEIVVEASVSKGLLFHYFYSKAGLYEFLVEYCARFALVEINSEFRKRESFPFFELQNRMTRAESRIMRQYPYLLMFLEKALYDEGYSNRKEVLDNMEIYTGKLEILLEAASLPEGMTSEDALLINGFLRLSRLDTAQHLLGSGSFTPDRYEAGMAPKVLYFEKKYTE